MIKVVGVPPLLLYIIALRIGRVVIDSEQRKLKNLLTTTKLLFPDSQMKCLMVFTEGNFTINSGYMSRKSCNCFEVPVFK